MLTVVTSLKSQRRNILEFITQAVFAARDGQPTPSLLPDVANPVHDSETVVAA